ncbi:sugar phosphate isomerase/epimerase family protein [Actinomycetes bacterium KLBMP 9759]
MRFAVFTCSTPEWTPEEATATLAAQGWDGIEWRVVDQQEGDGSIGFWVGNKCTWPASTFERDAPRIKEISDAAGLAVPSIGAYARCDDLDAVESLMRGAAAVGAPQMRVQVGKPGPEGYRATFEQRRKEYAAVADLSRTYGVKALIELHHQTLVSSASAAARFVEGLDPAHVGVIHDIGNMLIEGYEHIPWSLEILGEHLAHVHVKNAVPTATEAGDHTDWTWGWTPMRHGVGSYELLFESLKEIGYDGWVSVEDFSTDAPQADRVLDNLAYLRELTA